MTKPNVTHRPKVESGKFRPAFPTGFIAPCLNQNRQVASGRDWLHEITHNGFRVIAPKKGARVRLYSRPGKDLTYDFPLIVGTLLRLRSRSCIIDPHAVACDENGVTLLAAFASATSTAKAFCCTLSISSNNRRRSQA